MDAWKKYRKKPGVVEAYRWLSSNTNIRCGPVIPYCAPFPESILPCKICDQPFRRHGWVRTLEGGHIVCQGDWIIKGVEGELYTCKPDIFKQTYELAQED